MYPQEYIDYLVHFHGDRDYFECHEVLEEYWKKVDKNNKRSILVAFILLAVSNYHHRRRNFNGACKTLQKALNLFQENRLQLERYGFQEKIFLEFIKERLAQVQNQQPYTSLNLPISDSALLETCYKACQKRALVWGENSDLSNEEIVHRHTNRDRSDVILERKQALESKQKERQ